MLAKAAGQVLPKAKGLLECYMCSWCLGAALPGQWLLSEAPSPCLWQAAPAGHPSRCSPYASTMAACGRMTFSLQP